MIATARRFTAQSPCPVCGGYDGMLRGKGQRCHGYLSADREWCHCAREELAGGLEVEGEKDVDRLLQLGLVATCNSEGAGKWRTELNQYLAGRHVVLIPDYDKPGETHVDQVGRGLLPVAASVEVLRLPNLPHKGDV